MGFIDGSVLKNPPAINAGDSSSIPGSGRSAGEGLGYPPQHSRASLVAQLVTEFACNAGDLDLISGLGRSPGEGNGYPLQYSGLEDSMDCIVHGILQDRILEWVAVSFSRGSSQPRDQIQVSHTAGGFFTS